MHALVKLACSNSLGQIKIFRTGDFGKIVKCDGNEGRRLYYEGRIDMTMRIQGKEIELNDIAVAVESTELCVECAVLCYRRNKEDEVRFKNQIHLNFLFFLKKIMILGCSCFLCFERKCFKGNACGRIKESFRRYYGS